MNPPKMGTRAEWPEARTTLLDQERDLNRQRDELAALDFEVEVSDSERIAVFFLDAAGKQGGLQGLHLTAPLVCADPFQAAKESR